MERILIKIHSFTSQLPSKSERKLKPAKRTRSITNFKASSANLEKEIGPPSSSRNFH